LTAASPRAGLLAALFSLVSAASCTPDIGHDPVPEAMEFDTEAVPPRVPAPIGLIVNPATGHIDFGLAGTPLPDKCAESTAVSPAECEFDHYLETLDGFPTATPASAPATAPLDPATLTPGRNVVVVSTRTPAVLTNLALGFDVEKSALTLAPQPSWELGETYFVGVRGYGSGVRAASGSEVVGSPTMALLKQDSSLTCGATSAEAIDPSCPTLALLAQSQSDAAARANAVTLEAIRSSYAQGGLWQLFAAAGLPKEEVAVAWGFPIQTASVAELDPTVGHVPEVTAADEIRVAVHGPVDPSTVTGFVVKQRPGTVMLMDLTEAGAGNLVAGFPLIDASFANGKVVIKGSAPFVSGHDYGVFMTNGLKSPDGAPLVPAPVTVLLTLPDPLVDAGGHSSISTVADADAVTLEAGRQQLATLFDSLSAITGLTRKNVVYCFAFTFGAPR
jgi:hypothetical protein